MSIILAALLTVHPPLNQWAVATCAREPGVCWSIVAAMDDNQMSAAEYRVIECQAERIAAAEGPTYSEFESDYRPHVQKANQTPDCPPTAESASVPPGWDNGNSFAKDVCTERDDLQSDSACYAAWRREQVLTTEDACTAGYTRVTNETTNFPCPEEPTP